MTSTGATTPRAASPPPPSPLPAGAPTGNASPAPSTGQNSPTCQNSPVSMSAHSPSGVLSQGTLQFENAAAADGGFLGPHEPLLDAPPSAKEAEESAELMQQLQFTVETPKQGEARTGVLVKLEKLIRTWIRHLLRTKNYTNPDEHGGRLLCFGSYALGVHFPGADIDTLCIAPRDVGREDFFDTLVCILKKHKLVKELNPVSDAHVPVIKMKFDDVQIDLVFTSLDLERIPPPPLFNIGDDSTLSSLDDASQRSINGTRVAEQLLRSVPNVDNFRWALRGIKLWAKNRGIYGNIYGFPGGVAWAIMTAAVCQMYPQSPPGVILQNFFKYYASRIKLDGAPHDPIYLTKSMEVSADIGKKSWDKKNNQFELWPVLTPCPPYMNSCYNIGKATLRTLSQEFKRGDEILNGEGSGEGVPWARLWDSNDFFLRYKVFLQVQVGAVDMESFNAWCGYVESKMRHLVTSLETWPQYFDVHEIAETSYELELRVWPFMFNYTTPNERLYFQNPPPGQAAAAPCSGDLAEPSGNTTPVTPGRTSPVDAAMGASTPAATPLAPTPVHAPSPSPAGTPLQGPSSAAVLDEQNMELDSNLTGVFFIGIDTCEQTVSDGSSRQIVDFGGAIDQFYQSSLIWTGRTEKMAGPDLSLLKRRSLPDWVLSDTEREVIRKKTAGYEAKAAAKRKLRDDNMGDQAKLRRLSSALSTDAPAAVPAPLLAAGSAATSEEGVEPSSP